MQPSEGARNMGWVAGWPRRQVDSILFSSRRRATTALLSLSLPPISCKLQPFMFCLGLVERLATLG